MTIRFFPEGHLLLTPENQAACATVQALTQAMEKKMILEGITLLCNESHDLIVQVGPFVGRIPRKETALGIAEGTTRDIAILSLVGKPVSFTVIGLNKTGEEVSLLLSRRSAQEQALSAMLNSWQPGDVVPATVTHLEPFGVFVDIGCGIPSMIGVDRLSVSRISHPKDRLRAGQKIYAVVLGVDRENQRILLSHRELLGTWAENAALFRPGTVVTGTARGVKDYGVFVELTPNLSGLAERAEYLQEGDRVSVYLKSILPDRMKIKLLVIEQLPPAQEPAPFRYFITSGRIDRWQYAPEGCQKPGSETLFARQEPTPVPPL